MEYILAAYISIASAAGGATGVNTALSFDTLTQCNAGVTAWEATSGEAEATCMALPGGRYNIALYAADNDRAYGSIGLTTFGTSGQCNNAKTAFEASDGTASYARAACIAVPLGGRND